jgi:hypothetical protein
VKSTSRGIRAFLGGLIDYAGMFPPADLPLEPALENFLRYRQIADSWMLGGFILPVDRVGSAAEQLEAEPGDSAIRITMLGRGGPDWSTFIGGLEEEIGRIADFREQLGGRVETEVFETNLPGAELDFQIRADALVDRAVECLAEAGLVPFFEVPPGPQWRARAGRAIAALAKTGADRPAHFKLRTGGVVPEAFPAVDELAWVLSETASAGVALKCTAGLHHPIRQYRPEVGTKMHGFVNVFTAAVFGHTLGLPAAELAEVIAEEDPAAFVFDDLGIGWKSRKSGPAEIEHARRSFALSFGSCSFDEPREDLRFLGWLPPA